MTVPIDRAVGHAGVLARGRSASELEIIFMECGLRTFMPSPRPGAQRWAKNELIAATLNGALRAAASGDDAASDGLRSFICQIALGLDAADSPGLQEAARFAGYELQIEDGTAHLYPLDEPAAPLGRMITALESDFDRLDMGTAKNHYQQAIKCLMDGKDESANAQLRTTFEEVVVKMAELNGYIRQQQGAGGRAINYLSSNGHLQDGDGADYIRGLWKIVQTNGPHPGTSPAGEAYLRTQAITAAVRYLIDRFAPV